MLERGQIDFHPGARIGIHVFIMVTWTKDSLQAHNDGRTQNDASRSKVFCLKLRIKSLFLALLITTGAHASPDLGVRCISRTPLYWRYNVQYANNLPYLAPTHGQDPLLDQHWPNAGESIGFSAQVRNHGDQAVDGFEYRWKIDGLVQGGTRMFGGYVAQGATVNVPFASSWPQNLDDHTVTVEIDPNLLVSDSFRQNNTYTDSTNALSYSIWVEQGLYDRFNARLNGFGTRSFEDWIRWQFDAMRNDFARSVYPGFAANGILERIRIEEINVIPFDPNDLNNWRRYLDNDPHMFLNDGRWQFTSDRQTLTEKIADWDNYVNSFVGQIDWGLIHELSHQLGVIDEYRMNMPFPQANQVRTREGRELNSMHAFHAGGLMGGGYILPGYDGSYYDSHTAGYLNRNLHYRRGFYGEFLFDMPLRSYAQFFDGLGAPLHGARVDFYQKNQSSEYIYNTPTFSGVTDALGKFQMPNRLVRGTTTATGHTLRNNPFGQLSVVGQDGTMLVKVTLGDQEDFRWFEIIQLNEAFWLGNTQTTVVPFHTSIFPVPRGVPGVSFQNVALGKPTAASSRPDLAHFANDGDLTTIDHTWVPDPPSVGAWWQVDLGAIRPIGRAVVYPCAGNNHDWFSSFHLEVSRTGAFAGEQAHVPLESNCDESRAAGDYSLQRLTGLGNRVVYTFAPVRGRYFRIVSDVFQNWVQLQEFELYPFLGMGWIDEK